MAKRTVTTTGTGTVAVRRDAAALSVSATHRARTLAEALSGAESVRAAIVVTASAHVDPGLVASEGLATWPQHDDQGRPDGFEARHSLRVRCADLEVAAALLQTLVDQVGDRISIDGVALTSTPTAEDLAAAREAAYGDALARAEHLADLADGELGPVLEVVEGGPGRGSSPRMALAAKADVGFAGGVEDLSTSVTVTWRLRDA